MNRSVKLKAGVPDARRIVDRSMRRGIAWTYGQGYKWVREVLEPAVRALEKHGRRPFDLVLASEGRYSLGDVHDFNDAPIAAIRQYRRSLRDWPGQGAAWREIGSMQERMGHSSAALRALRKAVQVDPKDECARGDLESAIKYPPSGPALCVRGDRLWRARELVEAGRARAALRLLRGRRGVSARQIRARAHGAMGDVESVMREWTTIASGHGPVALHSADHFYLPVALHNDSRWWETLWRLRRRDANGNWNLPASFFSRHLWSLWQSTTTLRRRELHLRFHLARTRGDKAALNSIVRHHPWFVEARRELHRLTGKRRVPPPT